MLSQEETDVIADASQDMSTELQIIVLWICRVYKTNPTLVLKELRDTIADWQEYNLG